VNRRALKRMALLYLSLLALGGIAAGLLALVQAVAA
jgi:hypothetical protein